jgi:TPR repeat protein
MDEVLQCYQILGLEPGASPKAAKKSYRDLVKKWHPDKFANDPGQRLKAEEKLKEINLAFERVQDHQTARAHHAINRTPTRRRKSSARSSERSTRASSKQPASPPPAPEANETKASEKEKNSAADSSGWRARFASRPAMAAIIAWIVLLLLVLTKTPMFFGDRTDSHRSAPPPARSAGSIPLSTTIPAEIQGPSVQSREEAAQMMLDVLNTESSSARSALGSTTKEFNGLPPTGLPSGSHSQPAEELSLPQIAESLKTQLSNNAQPTPVPAATSPQEDPKAQFQLGLRYAKGEGVPQDQNEAIKLYRLAAEAGHTDAQKKLGFIYGTGQGVVQDLSEADSWLSKAASKGNADAGLASAVVALAKADAGRKAAADLSESVRQASEPLPVEDPEILFQLGLRHSSGDGVPLDFAEAIKWYRLAAGHGHVEAQKKLGFLYASGKGVPRDDIEAKKWFTKAGAQGNVGADFAKAIVSLAQKEEAKRGPLRPSMGTNTIPNSTSKENPEAHFQSGLRHEREADTSQDYSEAVRCYRVAAEAGHTEAQKKLGFLYASGKGVKQDNAEAQKWFRKAAAQGSSGAGLANAILSLSKSDKARDSAPSNHLDKTSLPASKNDARP